MDELVEGLVERLSDGLVEKLDVKLGVNEQKIITMLFENNTLTIVDLAKSLGISQVAVYKNINKLKEKGILKRVGSDKAGHWEIIEK